MLLTMEQIKQELASKLARADVELPELNMRPSKMSEQQLLRMSNALNVIFPEAFSRLLLSYDFGELTLGGVFFGQTGDYESFLVHSNSEGQDFPWWGTGKRPEEHLRVAGTDGYVILLDVAEGSVEAYLRSGSWKERMLVAADFELFCRGAGTAFLSSPYEADKQALAKDVAQAVRGHKRCPFWEELVLGVT